MQPGEILAGRYALETVVGRGGMGEVFRATDRALGREVAVKVLPRHLLGDERATQRFRREAQLAASLHHPHTVTVHDVVTGEGVEAIVMELVDGPTLADVLVDTGPMPWDRALRVAASVAAALEAAHSRGLVHRDVKPSNVLLTSDDTVKVTDFGIARTVEASQTVTGTVYGSVPYLAPEQALGDPTDARTDVYGLGCLLYEMLTGRPPYVADDAVGTVYQHLHADPIPPSERNPNVPTFVDDIVLPALERDAELRYQTAGGFAAVLREGADGIAPAPAAAPAGPPVAETRRMPPPPRGGRARRTAVRRGQPRRSVVPLMVALIVLVFAVLWLAGAFDDSATGADGAADDTAAEGTVTAAPPTATPTTSGPTPDAIAQGSPTASPTPTESDPPDPEDAARDVRAAIASARNEGELTAKAEDELEKALGAVMDEHAEGDDEEAFEKLEKMREELTELVEKREATERGSQLVSPALDELETSLRSSS